jgi:chemotaxis protein methyltransferase CheR
MNEPHLAAPPGFWADVSRTLEADTGLHFTPGQWRDMERGLALAAGRLGLPDAGTCAARLLARALDDTQRAVLAECLTVGETYFFRDPALFDGLARDILEPIIQARRSGTRHLRLWSAGCSTGEEPYSLAMLLATLLPDWRDWNICILATDLNAAALAKAQAGIYGRWSLRDTIPNAARPYLRALGDGRHEVDPALRRLVRFAPLNLVLSGYPAAANGTTAMDLILCRNVLIYFERARAQQVLRRLGQSLSHEGWLVTGSVEAPAGTVLGLLPRRVGALCAFRQSGEQAPAPPCAPITTPLASFAAAAVEPPPAATVPVPAPAPAAAMDPQEDASAAALAAQARTHADAGDLEQALALCRQAVARDKLNAEWTWLLSSILLERGEMDQALRALQRTLYLEPQHILARFMLGSLAMRRGSSPVARRHLALALTSLAGHAPDEVIHGSGGLRARELRAIITRMGAAA